MPQLWADVYYCLSSRTHCHPPKTSWYNIHIYFILYIIYLFINIFIYISGREDSAALCGNVIPLRQADIIYILISYYILYISYFIYKYVHMYVSMRRQRCTWRQKEATTRSWRRWWRQKRTLVRKMRWVSWKRLGWMLIGACAKVGCGMVTCGAIVTVCCAGTHDTIAR